MQRKRSERLFSDRAERQRTGCLWTSALRRPGRWGRRPRPGLAAATLEQARAPPPRARPLTSPYGLLQRAAAGKRGRGEGSGAGRAWAALPPGTARSGLAAARGAPRGWRGVRGGGRHPTRPPGPAARVRAGPPPWAEPSGISNGTKSPQRLPQGQDNPPPSREKPTLSHLTRALGISHLRPTAARDPGRLLLLLRPLLAPPPARSEAVHTQNALPPFFF